MKQPSSRRTDPGSLEEALDQFDPLWEQLNSWEREKMVAVIVRQVSYDGAAGQITVTFHSEQIAQMIQG